MKQGLLWYKHEPHAFLDGVQGMGPDSIGAYIVLIDLIYARGGETLRDDRHLAGILGCSKRLATALTDRLISLGKIEAQGAFITNSRAFHQVFEGRNVSERRVNAQRMRREREAELKKNNGLADKHVQVKLSREEKNRYIKDNSLTLVTENEIPPVKKSGAKKVGYRLPDDFKPDVKWSLAQGLPVDVLERELEKFKNYWTAKSGKDATKLDWQATWRNWIISAKERNGKSNTPRNVGEYIDQQMKGQGNEQLPFNGTGGLLEQGNTGGNSGEPSFLEILASTPKQRL